MTDAKTRQMIEILGDTLPDDMLDASEREVAEFLCHMCDLAGYSVSAMNKHMDAILAHAKRERETAL
jgi:hypothetical protein